LVYFDECSKKLNYLEITCLSVLITTKKAVRSGGKRDLNIILKASQTTKAGTQGTQIQSLVTLSQQEGIGFTQDQWC
jgi:hypothetical protein